MNVIIGLLDSMVLQRNRENLSEVRFAGKCRAEGRVVARVVRGGKAVKGFSAREVGRAAGGSFAGSLDGLAVGGPYAIELSIVDPRGKALERARIKDVLVGDVWIAAGQSNMQGCGVAVRALPKVAAVRAFMMDDRWRVARDPIHNMWDCVDQVHVDIRGGVRPPRPKVPNTGVGPSVAFAQEMWRRTKAPQGILACAHGGTSMAQWNPALGNLGGKSLYGATLRRLAKNGGRVAGVIWYQGESDARGPAVEAYTEKTKALIAAFRRDAGDGALPFALVQISRVVSGDFDSTGWNAVQDRERLLPRDVRGVTTVPAIDLDLDDLIHISGPEHERLGRRLAQAMAVLMRLPRAGKPPIELDRVAVSADKRTGLAKVTASFRNVEGSLRAAGRPSGFALSDPRPTPGIVRVTLKGASATLRTSLDMNVVAGRYLNYGLGLDPYCNITDAADRSLPAFSRVALGTGRAMTPFVHLWRRSEMLAAPADFAAIAPPDAPLRRYESGSDFCDLHLEIEPVREDRLIYFACRVRCAEDMKLAACFGSDGPAKMWIDGREVVADAKASNPAIIDRARSRFAATKGEHDVVLALVTNRGRAWGVYLRFERLDVSRKMLHRAPDQIVMPEFVERQ